MILLNRQEEKDQIWAISNGQRSEANTSQRNPQRNFNSFFFLAFLLMLAIAGIVYLSNERNPKNDFYEIKDGEPVLAPWREEKMLRELEEIDAAVKYLRVNEKIPLHLQPFASRYDAKGANYLFG